MELLIRFIYQLVYYNQFILNVLGRIESLGSIQSSFVMNPVKQNYGLCI